MARRNRIFVALTIVFMVSGCDSEPDMKDSYITDHFCFEEFRGVGVASVPNSSGSYNIPVLAEPADGADEIALLTAEISSQAKSFSVDGDGIAEDALFEFDYEHLGLPVELIAGDWVKVRLGKDASGNPLSGWVKNSISLVVKEWDTYLPGRATFLATCGEPVLYTSPQGESFTPVVNYIYDDVTRTKRPDYVIRSVAVDGDWMKVEFVTPSDLCGQASQELVITEGWVPFLLDDKSPAVWFYPRGC